MQQQGKSPVSIIQELLAILTTRKEASEEIINRLSDNPEKSKSENIREQSSRFINELMSELTQFGDGVSGDASRDNEYQKQWREALKAADGEENNRLKETFNSMEKILREFYRQVLTESTDLQESLQQLLKKQEKELSTLN